MITFVVEKRPDDNGQALDSLVRKEDGKPDEVWTTIPDLDRLFDVCSRKWAKHGWDLDKLITCINECEFE